jgi:hypothetical protein
MSELLTPEEFSLFAHTPETELVDLAIDLDVPVPEEIDLGALLDHAVRNLASLGKREGLPFSHYDKDDLLALDQAGLRSIAALNGVADRGSAEATTRALIKAGKKIYKVYRNTRPNSQIPMYLPMLLEPLARHLVKGED